MSDRPLVGARDMPDLRRRLVRDLTTGLAVHGAALAVSHGLGSVIPQHDDPYDCAAVLCHQEAARLKDAALYYVTAEMTALACAAAATAPLLPVDLGMAPAPSGLMVFGQKLLTYDSNMLDGSSVDIHAVSWGPWTAHTPGPAHLPHTPAWVLRGQSGGTAPDGGYEYEDGVWVAETAAWPDDLPATWVTFWSRTHIPQLEGAPPGPALQWDNEALLMPGGQLEAYAPDLDHNGGCLTVLYTCWQMMRQAPRPGRDPIVAVSDQSMRPVDARRARRQGYRHTDVRVVDIHRTVAASVQAGAGGPGERKGREYHVRWPVRPHRRSHCMRPRDHADGGCTHEEIIVPFQVRGPADKPLKGTDTVHVLSRPASTDS